MVSLSCWLCAVLLHALVCMSISLDPSERPALEEQLLTAEGNARRSLQFVLGRSYAVTSSKRQRDGAAADAAAELLRSYELLGALRQDPGDDPPPHLLFELAKLFGFVSRKQRQFVEAAEAYTEVMLHDLHLATHSKMFRCADPNAINTNPDLAGRGSSGVGSDCITANRLRYYGQLVIILERQLGRQDRVDKAFAAITEVPAVGWTSPWQISVNYFPGIEPKLPVWTAAEADRFRVVKLLRDNVDLIAADLVALLPRASDVFAHDPNTDEHQLVDVGVWTQVPLVPNSVEEKHLAPDSPGCVLSPNLCTLFRENLSELHAEVGERPGEGWPGGISFARLEPGTHLIPHTGPTNERLTVHLPLIAPPGPRMRVATESVTWRYGEVLVFDDSFEHEVWHEGTEDRIILHMNIWHPGIKDEKLARPGAPQKRKRKRKWSQQHEL